MQFRLSTLFCCSSCCWSSLAVFGGLGVIVFRCSVVLAVVHRHDRGAISFSYCCASAVLIALLLPAVQCPRGRPPQ